MINIRIDKSNKCNGEYSLYITFDYNSKIVDIMRRQSIRYYNPNLKEWEIPAKKLDELKEQLKDYELKVSNSNENQFTQVFLQNECNYIPEGYKFKISPFKHQVDGVNYGLRYDRFVLGDEQGLRKNNASY